MPLARRPCIIRIAPATSSPHTAPMTTPKSAPPETCSMNSTCRSVSMNVSQVGKYR